MSQKKTIVLCVALIIGIGSYLYVQKTSSDTQQTSVTEVVVRNQKNNLIQVDTPVSGSVIKSPFTITGKARGFWFFEASFPLVLVDGNGKEILVSYATAEGDWMTEEFVPFSSTITFNTPTTATGTLILKKDNPSGEAVYDDSILIPVRF